MSLRRKLETAVSDAVRKFMLSDTVGEAIFVVGSVMLLATVAAAMFAF